MKGHIVILFLCMCLVRPAIATVTRSVLVLYSDDRMLPANQEFDGAFNASLMATEDPPVTVFSEFLDRTRFSSDSHHATIIRYLREKYAVQPPSVLVAAGSYAMRLRAQHVFAGVPTIIVGVTTDQLESIRPLPPEVIGFPIEYDPVGTIKLALRLQPDTKTVVLVTGAGEDDRMNAQALRASVGVRYELEFLSGLPTAALLRRVARLKPHSIVFTPGYFVDGIGRHSSPREVVSEIAAVSNAPVYGPYNTFIGTGIVGGVMPNFAEIGRQTAAVVVSLLHGTPPGALKIAAKAPATSQIDWRAAQRWGIADNRIPVDAVIQFRTPTFWEAYGIIALVSGAVVAVLVALIVALLYERRREHRTAAALLANERRMILAARTAQVGNWVWSLAANGAATANGGEQPHVYVPLSLEPPVMQFERVLETTHVADRDMLKNAVRRAVAADEELDTEFRVVQHGNVRWLRARGRTEATDSNLVRGVAFDITQAKEAQLQSEQDRVALGRMTRVSQLGQLSTAIAHQLNQPLTAILSNAEVLQKLLLRNALDRDELREIVDDIIANDHRAAEVIRRLRVLYKNESRAPAPVDVNELIHETLTLLRPDLDVRQVMASTDLASALSAVSGDRVQLQQVLMNLIVNAADSMVNVDVEHRTLRIRTAMTGDGVRIDIEDHGHGIDARNLDHLFDMFFSTKPGGMGVGLAICRSIVAAHGGTLTTQNNPDGGATFTTVIPV